MSIERDNRETQLADMLRAIADEDSRDVVPSRIEEAVLAEWDAAARRPAVPRRHRGAVAVWLGVGTAASLLAIAVFTLSSRKDRSVATARMSTTATTPDVSAVRDVALELLDPDPSSLQVVRVRLTRDAAASMGVALEDLHGDGAVEIEVIVGHDGTARTVRQTVDEP